jgi:hypothetical protein
MLRGVFLNWHQVRMMAPCRRLHLQKLQIAHLANVPPPFTVAEDLLSDPKSSPVDTVLSYLNPVNIDIYFFKINFNIILHLCLGHARGLFVLGLMIKILYALLRWVLHVQHITSLFDFINLIASGEENDLCRSSLRSLLQPLSLPVSCVRIIYEVPCSRTHTRNTRSAVVGTGKKTQLGEVSKFLGNGTFSMETKTWRELQVDTPWRVHVTALARLINA